MTQNEVYALFSAQIIREVVCIVQRDPELKVFPQTHEKRRVSESLNGTGPD